MPPESEDHPQLSPALRYYLDAFWELSTCRPVSMGGEGQIPWTAIDRFASRAKMEDDQFERLRRIVRGVDSTYLDIRQKNAAEAMAEQKRIQAEEAEAASSGDAKAKAVAAKMARKQKAGRA